MPSDPRELVQNWVAGLDVEVLIAARTAEVSDLTEELRRADVVIGDAARRFPLDAATIAELDRCRLIMHPAVGLDGVLDTDAAAARGIRVQNAPGYNAEAVADWALMAMLMLLRGAVGAEQALRTDGWARLPLLRRSDVVTLHAPLTAGTRHLLDADRLALMPAGGVLVNAARGGLVDERALAAALADGRLQAAALDVFATEPLPADSPLRTAPNLYLSPHVAAGTEQARARVRALGGAVVRAELSPPGTD